MNNRRKSLYNLLYSALSKITIILINLQLPRLFIVSFGSETNGLLNSVSQILLYLGLFEAGVGATTLQALYKPVATDDKASINAILSATDRYYKRTGLLYFVVLIAFSFIYPFMVSSSLSYWAVFGVVFLSGIGNVVLFYFQGKYKILLQAEGKNYISTNLTTVITVVTGLSKVLLIYLGCNIVFVLLVSFLIQLLQALYILFYIKKNYKWISLKTTPDYGAISQKNFVMIHQIADMIFNNTDVLMLTLFCDLKVVSVYSMYKLVITHLESILSILSNGFSFDLGQTYQVDKNRFIRKIDIFESFYSTVSISMFSVTLSLIVPFMELYTQGVSDIEYCDPKLAILFVAIAILTAMRYPMHLTINCAGHFKLTTPQTITEAVINIVVSVFGVLYLGIYGVLLGTIAALLYRTFDIIIYSNVRILNRSPLKTFSISLVNIAVALVIQVGYMLLPITVDSYLSFAVVGSVNLFITFMSMFFVQCILYSDIRRTAVNVLTKIKLNLFKR